MTATLKTTIIQEPSSATANLTLDASGNVAVGGSSLTINGVAAVTTSGAQTLTNKTIDGSQLVDSSVTLSKMAGASVDTTQLVDASVTAAKLDGGQSGSQPIYANRAWVYFSGTTISVSGNVSSVATSGTNRQINFTTAMPNTNYAAQVSASAETNHWISARATGSVSVGFGNTTYTNVSVEVVR